MIIDYFSKTAFKYSQDGILCIVHIGLGPGQHLKLRVLFLIFKIQQLLNADLLTMTKKELNIRVFFLIKKWFYPAIIVTWSHSKKICSAFQILETFSHCLKLNTLC